MPTKRKKYGNEVTLADIAQIRAAVAELTAHIPPADSFLIGKLIQHISELSGQPLTINQLRHLRRVHLLRPQVFNSGERKTHRYTRSDLQDILVILKLIGDHRLPLTKIGGLLWAAERERHALLVQSTAGTVTSMPHDQMTRAQFQLRGRLLEIILSWLFGGQVPCEAGLILRQQFYPHRTENEMSLKVLAQDAEWKRVDRVLDPRSSDVVLTTSQTGEVLHRQEGIDWRSLRHYRWYHLLFQDSQPAADYHLILGVPPGSPAGLSPVLDAPGIKPLLLLLRLCFLQPQLEGAGQAATPLQALANLIPDISAAWQYCAILAPGPNPSKALVTLAHSAYFPRSVNLGSVQVIPEQLLSGWTFQTGQVCLVQQSLGRDDPRIARQGEEDAAAAIAVPTTANHHFNGVIYVGTQRAAPEGEVFSAAQITLLRLLGSVVGELIERQLISQQARQAGLSILTEQPFQVQPWPELEERLTQALEQVRVVERKYGRTDNLHLMAVRLDNYDTIASRSSEVAAWAAELLAHTAHTFYTTRYLVSPALFSHSSSEFVLLVKYLKLSDKQEQQLRRDLRDYLSTLVLGFDQGVHPTPVRCLVWSLPFNYGGLVSKLEYNDPGQVAAQLCGEVESALLTLPYIHEGHRHESQGAYSLAYNQMLLAHQRAPKNIYLMRHLAKICTRKGDYNNAIGWWQRVLNHDTHPRHYQHLAEVYALLEDYEASLEQYKLAEQLGPDDPRCYLGWGQVLLAMGEYAQAVEKFIAAQELDQNNQTLYTLRQAEAYFKMEDYRQAKDACERVLIWDPENQDAIKLLLQIQPLCPS